MNLIRSGLVFGFAIWAAATAIFVPYGHFVFGPDNPIPAGLAAGAIDLATLGAFLLFGPRFLARAGVRTLPDGALFAACTCLPGLVFDGALYACNSGRYPGLDQAASGAMCAGLLLAYAAALLGLLGAARVAART